MHVQILESRLSMKLTSMMWRWDMHVGCRHHVGGALRMWGSPGGWGWEGR